MTLCVHAWLDACVLHCGPMWPCSDTSYTVIESRVWFDVPGLGHQTDMTLCQILTRHQQISPFKPFIWYILISEGMDWFCLWFFAEEDELPIHSASSQTFFLMMSRGVFPCRCCLWLGLRDHLIWNPNTDFCKAALWHGLLLKAQRNKSELNRIALVAARTCWLSTLKLSNITANSAATEQKSATESLVCVALEAFASNKCNILNEQNDPTASS